MEIRQWTDGRGPNRRDRFWPAVRRLLGGADLSAAGDERYYFLPVSRAARAVGHHLPLGPRTQQTRACARAFQSTTKWHAAIAQSLGRFVFDGTRLFPFFADDRQR